MGGVGGMKWQNTDARVCIVQTRIGVFSGGPICLRTVCLCFPYASPRFKLSGAPFSLVQCFSNTRVCMSLFAILPTCRY